MSTAPNNAFANSAANNCIQRTLYFTYEGTSSGRYEIVSPYPKNTKAQLDMRRKAEVLKYKYLGNNLVATTKAQKWSNLINNTSMRHVCLPSPNIYTPTSSSNVPGPVMLLHLDENIPLYNYASITNSRELPTAPFNPLNRNWDIFSKTDVKNTPGSATAQITDLVLINPPNNIYTYTIQVPISIAINGNITSADSSLTNTIYEVSSISLNVSNIILEVYYSNSLIAITPVFNHGISPIEISFSSSNNGYFSTTAYIGNSTISNINLSTIPQYIYTFKINVDINCILNIPSGWYRYGVYQTTATLADVQSGLININLNSIQLSSIFNLKDTTDPYYYQIINCEITQNAPNYSAFPPFTLTGV